MNQLPHVQIESKKKSELKATYPRFEKSTAVRTPQIIELNQKIFTILEQPQFGTRKSLQNRSSILAQVSIFQLWVTHYLAQPLFRVHYRYTVRSHKNLFSVSILEAQDYSLINCIFSTLKGKCTYPSFKFPLNVVKKGFGFSYASQKATEPIYLSSSFFKKSKHSGTRFNFRLVSPSRFLVYTKAVVPYFPCFKSSKSQGKYQSLAIFTMFPTFISYHFLLTKPGSPNIKTYELFYFLSLRWRFQSSEKSFIIDTTTTNVRGINIVGFPYDTVICGIIWRMPMIRKYTKLERERTIGRFGKLIEQIEEEKRGQMILGSLNRIIRQILIRNVIDDGTIFQLLVRNMSSQNFLPPFTFGGVVIVIQELLFHDQNLQITYYLISSLTSFIIIRVIYKFVIEFLTTNKKQQQPDQSIQIPMKNFAFNLQNMETYFKHYIPCPEHPTEPITNFCTQRICLRFLCPQCVEAHSQQHANHPIESIRTCLKKTSARINQTVKQLEVQINKNAFLKSKSTEQYAIQLIKQLQQVRRSLVSQINSYFKQKQAEIKKQVQKGNAARVKMEDLKNQVVQAVKQLKMLNNNLFHTDQTVKAMKKANSIDYGNMIHHFKKQIHSMHNQLNYHVRLEMDQHKRQIFRSSLNTLIGVRGINPKQKRQKSQLINSHSRTFVGQNISNQNINSRYNSSTIQNQHPESEQEIHFNQAENFMINPPPLSADRLMNQASLRIQVPNYFASQPFLHFFEVSKGCLHITRINQIIEKQKAKWQVIPLNIDFKIPSFHRTIATENGNIYLIGGTFVENMKKNRHIYQYDPMNKSLKIVADMQAGRSSHSIVSHKKGIFIAGGMTENDEVLKKFQVFNPTNNDIRVLNSSKYATTNSLLCHMGDNIIKMGGVFATGENNDHIQIYNITAGFWGQIDPTIQNVKGQFGLLSCSAWAGLNNSQILIFGGYNEQNQNENSKMSFVLQKSNENEYSIKHVNVKNLPAAQGFWSQQGIAHKGSIYCLQNVDGEEDSQCLQDYRNLLIFNGKYWSSCTQ